MANIQAFRGVRYDLSRVGRLGDVIAPPYDVISEEHQHQLWDRHPQNVVRLELPIREGDEPALNRYRRAGVLWRNWRREGILQQDSRPALYVCHQRYEHFGRELLRRGFFCRLGLERFGEGQVFPHEATHPAAKLDRLNLMQEARANFSPIFGLYEDRELAVQTLLEQAIDDSTPLEATDWEGVRHSIWLVTDISTIAQIAERMGERAVFIADGHHRYETACQFRDGLSVASGGVLPTDHPANYILAGCFGMSDPGLLVLPTHRLFRGIPSLSSGLLAEKLGRAFECSLVCRGAGGAREVWEQIEGAGDQTCLGLYTRSDDSWTLACLTAAGKQLMQQLSRQSPRWNGLGVALLHRLAVEELLGLSKLPPPAYVRTVAEVITGLQRGDLAGRDATGQAGSGVPFELAALVLPAGVRDVHEVSLLGERMPPKSTFFYPKLVTGLVLNPLD